MSGCDILAGTDLPGFADPVAEAQSCFRAVLAALSRPGSLHVVPGTVQAPAPLAAAAAAVLLTLVDAETSVWTSPELFPCRGWIAFHCGAPAAAQANARFVACTELPDLTALDQGSDELPEQSATVILQVDTLGSGPALRLSGPGLAASATLRVAGLPAGFAAVWQANHALYPRGVDLILCAGNTLAGLPRSVAIEAA